MLPAFLQNNYFFIIFVTYESFLPLAESPKGAQHTKKVRLARLRR